MGSVGTTKKPWFCCMPSFWMSKEKESVADTPMQNNMLADSVGRRSRANTAASLLANSDAFEEVPEDIRSTGGQDTVDIDGLTKSFSGKTVVDRLNLTLYPNQICALLGH